MSVMQDVLVVIRLTLAAVFFVSSLAKLADCTAATAALRYLGAPPALARPGAGLLPLAELIIVIALLGSTTAWWGALGALALQVFFTARIARALARGKKLSCGCFGRLSAVPNGLPRLLCTETLGAAAAFVLWQDGTIRVPMRGHGPSLRMPADWQRLSREWPSLCSASSLRSILRT
jgi:hypothetical protein